MAVFALAFEQHKTQQQIAPANQYRGQRTAGATECWHSEATMDQPGIEQDFQAQSPHLQQHHHLGAAQTIIQAGIDGKAECGRQSQCQQAQIA